MILRPIDTPRGWTRDRSGLLVPALRAPHRPALPCWPRPAPLEAAIALIGGWTPGAHATGHTAPTTGPLATGGGTIVSGSNFTWTAGTGFTLRSSVATSATTGAGFLEDKIVSAAGAYNATATSSVSGAWECAVAAFKDANPGSSGPALMSQAC